MIKLVLLVVGLVAATVAAANPALRFKAQMGNKTCDKSSCGTSGCGKYFVFLHRFGADANNCSSIPLTMTTAEVRADGRDRMTKDGEHRRHVKMWSDNGDDKTWGAPPIHLGLPTNRVTPCPWKASPWWCGNVKHNVVVYNKDDKLRQTQKFVRGCDVNLVDNDKNGDACKAGVAIAYDARPARTFEVAQDKHDARDAYFKHYQDEYMKGREWCTHDETNTCGTTQSAPNYYKGERDHYYVEDRCEYQKDDTTCKDVPAVRRSLSNPLARGPKAHKCKATCKPTAKNPPLRTAKTFIPRGMKSGFSSPPEKWVNGCNTALTTTKPIEKTGEDGDAANLDKELKRRADAMPRARMLRAIASGRRSTTTTSTR